MDKAKKKSSFTFFTFKNSSLFICHHMQLFFRKSRYWPFYKPNWTHMRLARVKHKPTMTTSMEKANFFLLHNFYFWIFVKHFFQWSVGDFSKVEKVENSKFVNMHYTFFGMAWKISHMCKIILLGQSLNCMQQKFDFYSFYPRIFENQFERFQFFRKSQYWPF